MPLSPLRLRLLIVALLTVSLLGALDHTIVSTSLATIAGSLGALEAMSWVMVSYTLASTVLLPVLGKLSDLFGAKRVFLVSLAAFLLASLWCGFAGDMPTLIVARVVQGMSSAGLMLVSQTIIAAATTPRERPKYMSIIGAAFPIAIVLGPAAGGLLTDYLGWRWVFWINLPIGVIAFVMAAFAVPRTPAAPGRGRYDYAGTAALSVALVALVLAVSWLGDLELRVPMVTAFVIAVFGFVLLGLIERRVAEPLVPLWYFRNRTVAAGLALSVIVGIGLFSVVAYIPTYVQMAYGTSATVSGLVPIACVMGMLLTNLLTGFAASRTGTYRPYPIIGTALGALGMLGMALLPVGTPLWVPMVIMFVVGMGTGAFSSLVVTVVQAAVPRRETGTVTATVNLVRQIGATVSTAFVGMLIAVGVAASLPDGLDPSTLTPQAVQAAGPAVVADVAAVYTHVIGPIFGCLAVVFVIGIVAALLLPPGRLPDEAPEAEAPEAEHRVPSVPRTQEEAS